jgi:hypothetical protein
MGRFAFIILASAALTALVSIFLLWRYRRAVLRAMSAHAGATETPTPPIGTARGAAGGIRPLALTKVDHTTALSATPEANATYQGATRSLRRAALVYAGAGLVYALVFALAWAFVAEGEFLPFRTLLLVSYYVWPVVIVKPHEFLDYLGGRLSRQFVQGRADLAERLSRMDIRPDPDGRHRVNDFFCHMDTWQITMRRLAARSDAVLMDLRSFSPANQGCLYELEQLLGLVPLEDVVLVVDDTTDRPFLAATLQTLWQSVPADSPNRGLGAPQIRLFQVSSGSPEEVRALLKSLFGAQPQMG